MDKSESSKVGYRNPPLHSRFKKGNKEHLKRKKPKGNEPSVDGRKFVEIMSTLVPVKKNGKIHYKSRMEVIIDNIKNDALKGDIPAARDLIALHDNFHEFGEIAPLTYVLYEDDWFT